MYFYSVNMISGTLRLSPDVINIHESELVYGSRLQFAECLPCVGFLDMLALFSPCIALHV